MAKKPSNNPTKKTGVIVERTYPNGVYVKRKETTGRLIEVHSESGKFSSRPKSEEAAAIASERRSAALKRLADR